MSDPLLYISDCCMAPRRRRARGETEARCGCRTYARVSNGSRGLASVSSRGLFNLIS